jgi:acyl-CoA reductase-like NAD-dependent aldehyde dehydrogenase
LPEVMQSLSLQAPQPAQQSWARTSVSDRLQIVRRLRDRIAVRAEDLLDCFPARLQRTRAESLTAEIIPLAEACRFLELEAEQLLAVQKLSRRGRPVWLSGVSVEVRREPFGVVLLIGPSNYPLSLIGVQAVQALVAGNAVLVKPGRDGGAVAEMFATLAYQAGLPTDLLTVLDEQVESAIAALRSGVNKLVLTGSVGSGRAVLREAAEHLIPSTVELSGADAVFVQPGADLSRAADAIKFGSQLNGGDTCIAPKRIFVHHSVADPLRARLMGCDIPLTPVRNDDEALELAARSPYALGATIFGVEESARQLSEHINAGVVTINDMIVPTADPRVPFGGRGWSGFGTTRGAAGLLEMTVPKAVVIQRGKRLRHLEPMPANAEELFLAYLAASHAKSAGGRYKGWRRLIKAIVSTRKVNS